MGILVGFLALLATAVLAPATARADSAAPEARAAEIPAIEPPATEAEIVLTPLSDAEVRADESLSILQESLEEKLRECEQRFPARYCFERYFLATLRSPVLAPGGGPRLGQAIYFSGQPNEWLHRYPWLMDFESGPGESIRILVGQSLLFAQTGGYLAFRGFKHIYLRGHFYRVTTLLRTPFDGNYVGGEVGFRFPIAKNYEGRIGPYSELQRMTMLDTHGTMMYGVRFTGQGVLRLFRRKNK